ncbi:CPBP family intramembrane glutamic endopeptidase [Halocatena marina]|uniref:CPBP family intramembrane glutamic endopeptidase n=1 Tax=Halocatena marina TaxID=2934937 RepID=A0ABD5YQB7_9EURY
MPNWTAFSGLTGVVLVLLLSLARLSQGQDMSERPNESTPQSNSNHETEAFTTKDSDQQNEAEISTNTTENTNSNSNSNRQLSSPSDEAPTQPQFSAGMLLANVALSQGLFGFILVAGAWYTAIPPAALGLDVRDPLSVGLLAVGVGVVTGLGLYAANAVGAASATALGYEYEEQLRDLLTPETPAGWVLLLCGVLPIIAGFEELLFRGVLIGVLSSGFAISWFLAGGSSVAFAVGHGAQGRLGILVTGILGFALAVVFIYTNSLLAVVVAHYLVNALEFIIGGAMGIEWG